MSLSLWCDRLSTICAVINHGSLSVCVQRSIFISIFPFPLRDRHRHVSSQFISGECFLLPFNILHCSRSLACQCRLSNKLMVCLITLWDIWGRTEGGPPQRRLWALNKMDRTNRYRSAERNVLYGYAPWMNYFFYTTQGMSWFESIN